MCYNYYNEHNEYDICSKSMITGDSENSERYSMESYRGVTTIEAREATGR